VLLRLLQHLLIWLAASAAIVLGTGWGYAAGFRSHRTGPQVLAWTIATVAAIFGAALVQRAPLAILVLVAICAALFPFGVWLAINGSLAPGITYMIASAIYVLVLGPSCRAWLARRS
jgi:hypothetical protein